MNEPKAGEVYRYYKKGDHYRVVGVGRDSNTDEQVVIYEPLYENPAAKLSVRPLREWGEVVEWEGQKLVRFHKIDL